MAPSALHVSIGLSALAAFTAVRAETHTVAFDNRCGSGTPTLILNGKVVSNGPSFTQNGVINGIAYLQTGPCLFNGENCPLMEINLANPTCPGCGSSVDISLIPPHAYTVETSFAYFSGCDGQGKDCNDANCAEAFHVPTDFSAQEQCEVDNVNLKVTFCGDATQSGSSSSSPSPSSPSGTAHQIHTNANNAKCLDVQGGVFANGTPVQIFDCNGSSAQNWIINSGETKVQLAGMNFCLDAGSSPANGVGMKIWQCFDNLPTQQWFYTGDQRISLENQGFCLDLTNGSTADGNRVQIWQCTSNDNNQRWTL